MFTSNSVGGEETHIRFGNSGQISGQNNRFEFISTSAQVGSYYSTFSDEGIHRFDRGTTEYGRLGTNNFWRFGENNSGLVFGGLNGARQVEVVDDDVQFRLTFSQNSTGPNTDFFSNSFGNLQILPSGKRVAINLNANPTATIDVNGDARIRNVPTGNPNALIIGEFAGGTDDYNLRSLVFPNDNTQVLLGDGTWGAAPSIYTSEQGITYLNNVFKLGKQYGSVFPVAPFQSHRELESNGYNLILGGTGSFGIGLGFPAPPTERIDVNGNGRFRNVPVQGGQSIILGLQNGANVNDIEFSRLEFTGNAGDVLQGDGTWGSGNGIALCTAAPAGDLSGDSYIGLNGNNFYFTGQAATNDRVGVGYDCSALPAKLSVRSINGATTGIFSEVDLVSTGNTAGTFRAINGDGNTGVSGFGNGGQLTYGGYFSGFNSDDLNHGVYGTANGEGNYNFGVYGIAQNFTNGGTVNVGVYGEAQGAGTNYSGYFPGIVISTNFISLPSDIQFKENIIALEDVSAVIDNLNPVSFDYKTTGNAQYMLFDSSSQVGFIAQEVELILPELVKEVTHPAKIDSLGNIIQNEFNYKSISYEKMIPYLVADAKLKNSEIDSLKLSNQEKDSLITDLNDRLTTLENCLANILPALCNANNRAIEQTPEETQESLRAIIDVELRDGNTIVLNQNVPNPFAERTVITYSIPQTVQKAQIHFYDGTGALINSVDIMERGNGQLNVFANDLSSGTYMYTLIADGQVVATKRMVKQ